MMSFLWVFSIISYKHVGILFGVLTVPVHKEVPLVKVLPDFITVNLLQVHYNIRTISPDVYA